MTEIDRRRALGLLASAIVTTPFQGPPEEEIVPYAAMPEGLVPGEPRRFATTLSLAGYGRGFLGVSVDGRPIKIEGNPRHPYSLGATDVFAEAEILSLYDPDRSRTVRYRDQLRSWSDLAAAWEQAVPSASSPLALVTGRIVSPTTLRVVDTLRQRVPGLRWYRCEPVNDDRARAGARLAFGRVVTALPRLDEADVVLSLGADPLGHGPEQLHFARAFASRRGTQRRQRLYAVEAAWTLTGASADFRLALPPGQIREVGRLVAAKLSGDLGEPGLTEDARGFAEAVARELAAARGRAIVLAGEDQPAELHALCHWINAALQAPNGYVAPSDPVEADHGASLTALADDLRAGRISALVVADTNPVYDAPDALGLAEAISALPFSAHLGLYPDETSRCCQWQLPLSHSLESWGDGRAPDGVVSLVQPLIRRLHDSRTRDELLALLTGVPTPAYDLTRETWRPQAGGDFEAWWRRALHDGVIAGSAAASLTLPAPRLPALPVAEKPRGFTLATRPDPSVWDGRFADNAWLQECAKPFTRQVWGNAAQLSPEDANRLGIADRDSVEIEREGQVLRLPALVMPGQAPGVVVTTLGHGRRSGGRFAQGVGARAVDLITAAFDRSVADVSVRKSGRSVPFHSLQDHTSLQGPAESLFQTAPLTGTSRPAAEPSPPTLLPEPQRGEYAWAMVVDTDSCIGCNACVVACQAENNVPVVGPEEVSYGRDMHWLRVDSYAFARDGQPRQGFQPVPCMHCELAPCEPVCPVAASVHDHEGLNVQVYNRCIGTRFCEANCPYKVRRFNWFAYAGAQAYGGDGQSLTARHNPDVSVRGRGVMEKCNYCLQRISHARRAAEREGRPVAEGEVVTACQAACPTRAIHFGDLNREKAEVSRLRRSPLHYTLLEELNTKPRTTYLKRVYGDAPA